MFAAEDLYRRAMDGKASAQLATESRIDEACDAWQCHYLSSPDALVMAVRCTGVMRVQHRRA